ncbi:MAG: di-heme oxidoredictase family protein, partial [Pseudomonadota bacterium]
MDLSHRTDLDQATIARLAEIFSAPTDTTKPQPFEAMAAGAGTVRATGDTNAFSKPAANLPPARQADFAVGNGVFKKLWTPSPSSTLASDGLGPFYNSRACQRCHLKDGRGHPPPEGRYWEDGETAVSFVLGLSVPADENDTSFPQSSSERVVPTPNFGAQLHDFAIPGLAREGRPTVRYEMFDVTLNDGTSVELRRPAYGIAQASGAIHPKTRISPRVANPMIGLGLLEGIHEADIRATADPEDTDGDGVSGRVSAAIDVTTGEELIGRFGWKATQPTVRQQSAFAFATDMGLSTSLVPAPHGDCTAAQVECLKMPTGEGRLAAPNEPEVPDELLDLVTFYAANLGVPRRRDVGDPQVLRGKAL